MSTDEAHGIGMPAPLVHAAYSLGKVFAPLWLALLVGTLGIALFLFTREQRVGPASLRAPLRFRRLSKAEFGACASFGVYLLLYLRFMFWGEDFAYHDHFLFTDFTGAGNAYPFPIWPTEGRFFPLAYQEYNLLGHLSASAGCYLALTAVQLVISLACLFSVLRAYPVGLRLFALGVLTLAPGFAASFADLTYPERNIVFWICVLIYAVDRYDQKATRSWLVVALISAHFALYYKEATVVLIGAFALMRLLLTERDRRAFALFGWQAPPAPALELGMLTACFGFALLLGLTLAARGESAFLRQNAEGVIAVVPRYLVTETLLTVFGVTFALRLLQIWRGNARFDRVWDSLAIAGLLHALAIASVGMFADYYMAPAEAVAAVTLLRTLHAWWLERPSVRPWLTSLATATTVLSVLFGTFRLVERKSVVRSTVALGAFIAEHVRNTGGHDRLYFPVAEDWRTMNLLAFLRYRGLPVLTAEGTHDSEAGIEVVGPQPFDGDRCVSYRPYVCRHQSAPRPGDLVVFLPEDQQQQQAATASALPNSAEMLFESPALAFPEPLYRLVTELYRVTPVLRGAPLPAERSKARVERVN